MAGRGLRRFSQAISEGDGISIIVEVDGAEAARLAQGDGAEAIAVGRGDTAVIRAATELPILTLGRDTDEGADACVVDIGDDGDDERMRGAYEHGLDVVVRVRDDDELERALEWHDPEILLLAGRDIAHALELLSDVPVGKLAIVEAHDLTHEQVVELERRGMDAVIVRPENVAALVGDAPPSV